MSDKPLTDLTFSSFELHPALQAGLEGAGFTRCTPIQALTLPVALPGGDVAGQAQTGTGKTLAFLVAVVERTGADLAWHEGRDLKYQQALDACYYLRSARPRPIDQRLGPRTGLSTSRHQRPGPGRA